MGEPKFIVENVDLQLNATIDKELKPISSIPKTMRSGRYFHYFALLKSAEELDGKFEISLLHSITHEKSVISLNLKDIIS